MIRKEYSFSKFFILLGKITRKMADLGFTLPEKVHQQFVKSRIKSIYLNSATL